MSGCYDNVQRPLVDRRLLVAAVASFLGHFVIAHALDELPPYAVTAVPRRIEVSVVEPPAPPPEPEPPPPEPPSPPSEPVVQERPRPRTPAPVRESVAPEPAASETPSTATTTTTSPSGPPVFGVTMESTSQGGTTNVPVGNTAAPAPAATAAAPSASPPAAAHEVTRMPIPQGRCSGTYTVAAREAGIEGVVVLDLVVDESGRARDIVVVERVGHGLTEAAIAALKACRFAPGEKDGKPVVVRVRGFKIRFMLGDAP